MEEKKASSKKKVIWIVLIVIIGAAVAVAAWFLIKRQKQINLLLSEATKNIEAEKYDAAAANYDALDGLKYNTSKLRKELKTRKEVDAIVKEAETSFSSGKYDDALEKYESLDTIDYATDELKEIAEKKKKLGEAETNVELNYEKADFDKVEECYDQLDQLGEDTSAKREILDYDRENYDTVHEFHSVLSSAYEKTQSSFVSNYEIISSMAAVYNKLDKIEYMNGSRVSNYAQSIRGNLMYEAFRSQYINNTSTNFDYYLTDWGYTYIINTYLEELIKEEYPFKD